MKRPSVCSSKAENAYSVVEEDQNSKKNLKVIQNGGGRAVNKKTRGVDAGNPSEKSLVKKKRDKQRTK